MTAMSDVPLPHSLLLATRSPGKLRELRPMFESARIAVIDLAAAGVAEQPVEDELEVATTFEENALAKARYFHRLSGLPTIADDSGLEVFALDGRPGVHSKRWSGRQDLRGQALDDANNALLLEQLERAADILSEGEGDRRARYVCVAAYCDANIAVTERGETRGRIARAPRGNGGFGYDPYFESEELEGRTFGEVSMAEKARVSHRARAFAKLLQRLSAFG